MLKTSFLFFSLLVSVTTLATTVTNDTWYQQHQIDTLTVDEDAYHFLVLGDWGRNGHFYQRDVAKWMDMASWQLDAEFIATTGDNFYDNGVASVSDPYWQSAFEEVYHYPHLFIDWHPTLGNHDYRGNWQAQIDYSQRSRRWEMPAPYYKKAVTLDDGTRLLFLFLDTSPLNPAYDNEEKYAAARAQGQQQQLRWLETSLANSDADWNVVIGHHPLYSSGKRYGKTSEIRDVLEPVFEKYRVDAYFAGHEHDMQHNRVAGKHVEHFISGGGSEVRPVSSYDFTQFARSTGGFATVSVRKTTLDVQFVDHSGNKIYHYTIKKGNQP